MRIMAAMGHYLQCVASGTFCALCYEGKRGRAAHQGHFGWREPRRRHRCMGIVRRSVTPSGGASSSPTLPLVGSYWAGLPDLVSFLRDLSWPDGSTRTTGTLMLMAEGGCWKCWLHDREAAMGCFVAGQTLEECLQAASDAVGREGADWRPDRKGGTRRS